MTVEEVSASEIDPVPIKKAAAKRRKKKVLPSYS
jgi:hypothetical protein